MIIKYCANFVAIHLRYMNCQCHRPMICFYRPRQARVLVVVVVIPYGYGIYNKPDVWQKLDLQQAGAISAVSSPKAAFDHTGMIFSIMAAMPNPQEGNYVHLYDARNYSGGAFAEFKLTTALMQEAMKTHQVTSPPPGPLSFTNIDFNLSGDRVLLQSREGLAVVLDGFEGTIQRIFQPSSNTTNSSSIGVSSCFTPDGKSMLMGNTTGTIDVYDLQSGTVVKELEVVNREVAKVHPEAATITALTCNPKYQQIASSSTDTCLWIW